MHSYPPGEVLGRVERRRRYTTEEKVRIVAEATAEGASVVEVARRHGLNANQVYKWVRLARLGVIGIPGASELPSFVAVELRDDPAPAPRPAIAAPGRAGEAGTPRGAAGRMEIVLGGGRRVRVDRHVDAEALGRVIAVLERG